MVHKLADDTKEKDAETNTIRSIFLEKFATCGM